MADEASDPSSQASDPASQPPPVPIPINATVPLPAEAAPPIPDSADLVSEAGMDQISIDELLKQASFEDPASVGGPVAAPEASDVKLPNFHQVMQDAQVSSIDLLRDVELNVKIELGRARMLVE